MIASCRPPVGHLGTNSLAVNTQDVISEGREEDFCGAFGVERSDVEE
jgi:hypothetical protein